MFFRTLYRSHFLIFVGKIAVVRSFAGRKYSFHLIVYGVPIYTYCSSNGPSSPEWRAKKVQFHLYQHSYLTCYFSLEHIPFLCMHIYDNTRCFLPGKNFYNLLSSVSLKRLAMQAVGETNKAYYGRCTNYQSDNMYHETQWKIAYDMIPQPKAPCKRTHYCCPKTCCVRLYTLLHVDCLLLEVLRKV